VASASTIVAQVAAKSYLHAWESPVRVRLKASSAVSGDSTSQVSTPRSAELLTLLDWKRRIFELYQEIRASDPEEGWQRWREVRDELFRNHPCSPLPQETRAGFEGLDCFPYDAAARVQAEVLPLAPKPVSIGASGGKTIEFERFGEARFELEGEPYALELFWLAGYGGGVFLPFADETSGTETYPAGRYLLDTVKGSDLGGVGDRLMLDFNFAYNPSCAYDPHWICPLAPPANRLALPIRAGERQPAFGADQ
jgi:hypothetical protein